MAPPELDLVDSVARLAVAMVLAGAVGAERELRDQDAGLRTHMLVGMGAALFVIVGNYAWDDLRFGNTAGVVLDPSRVVAYVVTGIGFLGAGTIIKNGTSIRGLTTAASLWVVAAVGVTAGAGELVLATVATVALLASLWPMRYLSGVLDVRSASVRRFRVSLRPDYSVAGLTEVVEQSGLKLESMAIDRGDGELQVDLLAKGTKRAARELIDLLAAHPGTTHVDVEGLDDNRFTTF